MKIPKEYSLLFIIGLFVSAYILDLVVQPLNLQLESPYHFFTGETMSSFPFSTASIFIKSVGLFLTPLWLLSFFEDNGFLKPVVLFVWSGLIQLYAIQDVVTRSEVIPLEWSLPLAAAGFALLIPTLWLFLRAFIVSTHESLSNAKMHEALKKAQDEVKKESKKED